MNRNNYFLKSIDKNCVKSVRIPFSKSVLFPLSSQFDYQGNFLRMSNAFNENGELLKNGLYKYDNIELNEYSFRINGLQDIFDNSDFPEVNSSGIPIYLENPYFKGFFPNKRRNIEQSNIDKLNVQEHKYEVVIPVDVVLKYFFGYSALLLDLLIMDRLKMAIFDVSFDEKTGRGKLSYDSKLISRKDVDSVAGYFFTKDDFANKMFTKIGAYFSNIRLNNPIQPACIKFKLPFSNACKLSVVGQYFKNVGENPKTSWFLVNEIVGIKSIDGSDFFLTKENIDIIDVNPSDVIYHEKTEGEEHVKGGKFTGEINPVKDEDIDYLPLDQKDSDKIVRVPFELRKCFNQLPGTNHLIQKKSKNGEFIYIKDERPDNHTDFPDFEGKKRRRIGNITGVDWRNIFYEVIEYLIEKYGYETTCLSSRKTEERIGSKIIYELKYEGVKYYLIETGGKNYFPIFRNQNKKTIGIDTIIEIVNIIDKKYKSSWLPVSNKKSLKEIDNFEKLEFLKNNDITFLRNNTHEERNEDDDNWRNTVGNQAEKIHKKIKKDLKELTKN